MFAVVVVSRMGRICEDCDLSYAEFKKRLAHFAKRTRKAFDEELKKLGNAPDNEKVLLAKISATVANHIIFAQESLSLRD